MYPCCTACVDGVCVCGGGGGGGYMLILINNVQTNKPDVASAHDRTTVFALAFDRILPNIDRSMFFYCCPLHAKFKNKINFFSTRKHFQICISN